MAIQRGEIYFVNLNPVQGREQAGRRPICWDALSDLLGRPTYMQFTVFNARDM